ncbi:MAG: hypothetical protein CMA00_003225, partial [Methanobacteriota archaeon]
FEDRGGAIFLSLAMSYILAALIAPSELGIRMLRVSHDGVGILNSAYWYKSLLKLIPIILASGLFSALIITQLGSENIKFVKLFLAFLFVAMSVFQALSLNYGWVIYSRRISRKVRPSKDGRVILSTRILICIILFIPLVWWFGFQAGDPSEANIIDKLYWIFFLGVASLLMIISYNRTRKIRSSRGVDGRSLDRLVFLIVITACWHLLGAWRRSPVVAEKTTGSMMIEEVILMSASIFLAVWSMANRGRKNDWKIFQGQSAVFWGIGFGFAYAGSISSLTALSEGTLLTTTAIGHGFTALVMIGIIPITVSWVGPAIDGKVEGDEEITSVSNPEEGLKRKISMNIPDEQIGEEIELLD